MAFEYLTNIPLEEARETYLKALQQAGLSYKTETIQTSSALGRVTANAVSARTSHGLCRRPRRKREDRRTPSVANTMRGSGDHHSGGWPGENHGKMP